MNNNDIASRKERLMSEFMGMCTAFNVDNCSMVDLMEELFKDHTRDQKKKVIK